MSFRELEKIIEHDGWELKNVVGSHFQYVHKAKNGKVTIPAHGRDISKAVVYSVYKQAQIPRGA